MKVPFLEILRLIPFTFKIRPLQAARTVFFCFFENLLFQRGKCWRSVAMKLALFHERFEPVNYTGHGPVTMRRRCTSHHSCFALICDLHSTEKPCINASYLEHIEPAQLPQRNTRLFDLLTTIPPNLPATMHRIHQVLNDQTIEWECNFSTNLNSWKSIFTGANDLL